MTHPIYDSDTHFKINHITRGISNTSSTKTTLIKGDHNSERFTFELPRHIEGHDMSLCNLVEVHYINIDASTKQQITGVYEVTDLQVHPDDEEKVICSWLISANATTYAGSLNFVLRFSCITDEDVIEYAWNTGVCMSISVSDGIYNASDMLEGDYLDVLQAWKNSLYSNETVGTKEIGIDEEPIDGSTNLVTSGGLKKYFDKLFANSVNTTYTIKRVGNEIILTGSDETETKVDVPLFGEWQTYTGDKGLTEGGWHIRMDIEDKHHDLGLMYCDRKHNIRKDIDVWGDVDYRVVVTLNSLGGLVATPFDLDNKHVDNLDVTFYYRRVY